jgi:hypothetical protein
MHHWQAWLSLASALLPAIRWRGQEASLQQSSSSRETGSTSAAQHQVQGGDQPENDIKGTHA